MIDWNIQTRSDSCQACHKPFENKQPFHTLLFDQKRAYERLDVCETCWGAQFSQGASDRIGFISYWQGIYMLPPPPPPEPIQKETAESLLRKLVASNDPLLAPARFILAVMLERKRLLKVKAQLSENNQRIFIYEHVRTGDLFTIPDPDLQLDHLEDVQQQVATLLEHGLPENSHASTSGQNPEPHNLDQPAETDSNIVEPVAPQPTAPSQPTS